MSELTKATTTLPERIGKVMLTDWSTSMGSEKEATLKKAIKELVPKHPNTKLVAFGESVKQFKAHDVDVMTTGGNTPMGKALEMAWKMRVEEIILITDGEPNDWTTNDILEEAEEFFFIPIHIIGIGDPYSLELNEPFLKELARITDGSYNRIGEGELCVLICKVEALLGEP